MPKCSTCAYEIPKHATNCSNCGYLVAPLAGAKEQTFARQQSSEDKIPPAQAAATQVPLNPQVMQHQHPFDLGQVVNQQVVQQTIPQTSMPFQVTPNPVPAANVAPNIEQFQQKQQQMPTHPPPAQGMQQQYGAMYPHTYPYQPSAPVIEQKSSDVSALSVLSLALGIIALISSCIPFLGLPFGIGGIICGLACKDKKTKGASMALVVTGVIFSVLGLLLSLAMLLFWITEPSSSPLSPEQFIF